MLSKIPTLNLTLDYTTYTAFKGDKRVRAYSVCTR